MTYDDLEHLFYHTYFNQIAIVGSLQLFQRKSKEICKKMCEECGFSEW